MKLRLAILAAALATACSPAPADEAAGPAADAPAAKRAPLPDCAATMPEDLGADGWKHPDCRLMLADQSGLALEFRYAPAEDDSTEVTGLIVGPGDATVQEFKERMGSTFNRPSSEDVDGDGKADILAPLETGNVNTTWALWRQVEGGRFVRVGELSGVSITHTPSGYIAVQGRSSAAEYYVDFFRLGAAALERVATVRISVEADGDVVTGADCTLEGDPDAPPPAGPTEDLRAALCAEPFVQGLIRDMTGKP